MQELLPDEVALGACELRECLDLLRDALLLLEREAHRLDDVPERGLRRLDPGILTASSASSRYWTIIIAWFRSSTAWR